MNSISDSGLLARHTSAGGTCYAFDPQGSTSRRLAANGSILSTSTFDAFGVTATNDTSGDPFGGFGAQYGYCSDFETGLQLLGMRYYDTMTGRFVTRDPIGYEGGVNLNAYGGNNPVGNVDPDGTASCCHENGTPAHWFVHLGIEARSQYRAERQRIAT